MKVGKIKAQNGEAVLEALEGRRKTVYALAQELGLDTEKVVTCSMRARFSNIQDNFNGIKVLTRAPITRKRSVKKITDVSAFFSKFRDGTITHFYTRPSVTATDDRDRTGSEF